MTGEQGLSGYGIVGVVLAGLAAVTLAGCDEEERNRPLHYEKGVYGGKPDQELTEEERRKLRQRGELQRF